MLADERLREGKLDESLADLQERVRKDPANANHRIFLFQLLAVLGDWNRAATQLKVAGQLDAGTLAMPEKPATLYVMTGDGFDAASGTVTNGFLRWVVYTPWATTEETGLPAAPTGPGAPWLMFPGTAGAHIMITPPLPGAGN